MFTVFTAPEVYIKSMHPHSSNQSNQLNTTRTQYSWGDFQKQKQPTQDTIKFAGPWGPLEPTALEYMSHELMHWKMLVSKLQSRCTIVCHCRIWTVWKNCKKKIPLQDPGWCTYLLGGREEGKKKKSLDPRSLEKGRENIIKMAADIPLDETSFKHLSR